MKRIMGSDPDHEAVLAERQFGLPSMKNELHLLSRN
jgi:hypothetical protein